MAALFHRRGPLRKSSAASCASFRCACVKSLPALGSLFFCLAHAGVCLCVPRLCECLRHPCTGATSPPFPSPLTHARKVCGDVFSLANRHIIAKMNEMKHETREADKEVPVWAPCAAHDEGERGGETLLQAEAGVSVCVGGRGSPYTPLFTILCDAQTPCLRENVPSFFVKGSKKQCMRARRA